LFDGYPGNELAVLPVPTGTPGPDEWEGWTETFVPEALQTPGPTHNRFLSHLFLRARFVAEFGKNNPLGHGEFDAYQLQTTSVCNQLWPEPVPVSKLSDAALDPDCPVTTTPVPGHGGSSAVTSTRIAICEYTPAPTPTPEPSVIPPTAPPIVVPQHYGFDRKTIAAWTEYLEENNFDHPDHYMLHLWSTYDTNGKPCGCNPFADSIYLEHWNWGQRNHYNLYGGQDSFIQKQHEQVASALLGAMAADSVINSAGHPLRLGMYQDLHMAKAGYLAFAQLFRFEYKMGNDFGEIFPIENNGGFRIAREPAPPAGHDFLVNGVSLLSARKAEIENLSEAAVQTLWSLDWPAALQLCPPPGKGMFTDLATTHERTDFLRAYIAAGYAANVQHGVLIRTGSGGLWDLANLILSWVGNDYVEVMSRIQPLLQFVAEHRSFFTEVTPCTAWTPTATGMATSTATVEAGSPTHTPVFTATPVPQWLLSQMAFPPVDFAATGIASAMYRQLDSDRMFRDENNRHSRYLIHLVNHNYNESATGGC